MQNHGPQRARAWGVALKATDVSVPPSPAKCPALAAEGDLLSAIGPTRLFLRALFSPSGAYLSSKSFRVLVLCGG